MVFEASYFCSCQRVSSSPSQPAIMKEYTQRRLREADDAKKLAQHPVRDAGLLLRDKDHNQLVHETEPLQSCRVPVLVRLLVLRFLRGREIAFPLQHPCDCNSWIFNQHTGSLFCDLLEQTLSKTFPDPPHDYPSKRHERTLHVLMGCPP